MGGRFAASLALASAFSLLGSGARASTISLDDVIQGVVVEAGQTVFLDENGSQVVQPTRTGVTFKNLSSGQGQVSVQFLPGPALRPGDGVGGGFLLLDGTLRVSSSLPARRQLVRIRMGYDGRRLARAGARESSVRLLRRRAIPGRTAGRWLPAIRAVQGRYDIVRYPDMSPGRFPGNVGNHGFDRRNQFVWAYLDVTSDYGVGALAVAEPASLAFLVSGVGLLVLRRVRRHS
jgi:hypothetical protein